MTLRLWLLRKLKGVDMKDHAYIRAANDQQQLQIKKLQRRVEELEAINNRLAGEKRREYLSITGLLDYKPGQVITPAEPPTQPVERDVTSPEFKHEYMQNLIKELRQQLLQAEKTIREMTNQRTLTPPQFIEAERLRLALKDDEIEALKRQVISLQRDQLRNT